MGEGSRVARGRSSLWLPLTGAVRPRRQPSGGPYQPFTYERFSAIFPSWIRKASTPRTCPGDPSFDRNIVKHGLELKKYGEKRKIAELTLPTMRVHKARCWTYVGLAAALNGAVGAVGCPVDGKLVLMTIGPVKS